MEKGSMVLSDCQYDITKQLVKISEFLYHVDRYLKDAEKEGDQDCIKVFSELKADMEKHANNLKTLINKFQ